MNSNKKTILLFFAVGLLALIMSLLLGLFALTSYLFPEIFSEPFSFRRLRPLHVGSAVGWLFAGISAMIYYVLTLHSHTQIPATVVRVHLAGYFLTGILILIAYGLGYFGGREYWEYPPFFALFILGLWFLFGFYLFQGLKKWQIESLCHSTKFFSTYPTYLWMWATGWLFFLFTFLETYAWTLPFWGKTVVRDITTQWKAQGALVGSWNMFLYGFSLYITHQTNPNNSRNGPACTQKSWFLYLLGLINLVFGWAHHVYPVPNARWIRLLAYAVSMTELLVLANIIHQWRKQTRSQESDFSFPLTRQWLQTTEIWIFINLILAILISIPAVNYFTHGTHFTVAHAMGTTIGINSTILFASLFYFLEKEQMIPKPSFSPHTFKGFHIGLALFWTGLIGAGALKAYYVSILNVDWLPFRNIINMPLSLTLFGGLILIIIISNMIYEIAKATIKKKDLVLFS